MYYTAFIIDFRIGKTLYFMSTYLSHLHTGPGDTLGLQNASGTSATRSLSDSRTSLRSSPGADRRPKLQGTLGVVATIGQGEDYDDLLCTRAYCCDMPDIDWAQCVQE